MGKQAGLFEFEVLDNPISYHSNSSNIIRANLAIKDTKVKKKSFSGMDFEAYSSRIMSLEDRNWSIEFRLKDWLIAGYVMFMNIWKWHQFKKQPLVDYMISNSFSTREYYQYITSWHPKREQRRIKQITYGGELNR